MLAFAIVLAIAALTSLALTPMVIRLAVAWGIFDAPHGDRRVHTEPLPRVGGVAVFAAMGLGIVASALLGMGGVELPRGTPGFLFGVLFGSGIVFATGLIDDIRGLRPGAKFAAQLIAALIVYSYGFRIDALSLGTSGYLELGWLSLPLTIFWIVGVTNAFNLIDGLDGLATGIALVALSTTLVIAAGLGNGEVVILCAALIGALVAFLRYNFSPARIFLGDSGSNFLGFMLAVLSVSGALNPRTNSVLVLIPIFALAIPLLDTSLAIMRRWLRGIPLSQADGRHVHHRLLAMGLSHRNAVIVLYAIASVLAVLGLALVFAPPPAVISVVAGSGMALLMLLYGLRRLQYHEFMQAGAVLSSGLGRVRRVIRDQIYAQDVGEVLKQAEGLPELNAILEDNAATFGFLHMEVCRESSVGTRPLVLFNGHVARAWKLDYPVTSHDFVEGDDYVLRIWCNPRMSGGPYGAERVACILAPTIEAWIQQNGIVESTPRPAVGEAPLGPLPGLVADLVDHARAPSRIGARVRPGA